MLSLIVIIFAVMLLVAMIRNKPKSIILWFFSLFFIWGLWLTMFIVIKQNDSGYYKEQVESLTEANKQIKNWLEISKDKLSDNPEFLDYVDKSLRQDLEYNNEEIDRCLLLQNERVEKYRFWIYFNLL